MQAGVLGVRDAVARHVPVVRAGVHAGGGAHPHVRAGVLGMLGGGAAGRVGDSDRAAQLSLMNP